MASYTAEQLRGAGTPTEGLGSGNSYNFTLVNSTQSGSSYFTFETVRNSNGDYSGSVDYASGTFSSLSNVQTLVSSSYIFSVVVNPGNGSFTFTPNNTIPIGGAFLRATGDTTLEIGI